MEAIVETGPCICGGVVFNGSLCSGVEGIELEKLIDICVMQVQQIHILFVLPPFLHCSHF